MLGFAPLAATALADDTALSTADVSVQGQSVSASVGVSVVSGDSNTSVTGQSTAASAGTVTVQLVTPVLVTGQFLTSFVGQVAFGGDASTLVVGQSVTLVLGTASGVTSISIPVGGFQMQLSTSKVLVWGTIVPGQTPGFNPVVPVPGTVWTNVTRQR